jgi:hypothetical protein
MFNSGFPSRKSDRYFRNYKVQQSLNFIKRFVFKIPTLKPIAIKSNNTNATRIR